MTKLCQKGVAEVIEVLSIAFLLYVNVVMGFFLWSADVKSNEEFLQRLWTALVEVSTKEVLTIALLGALVGWGMLRLAERLRSQSSEL